MRHFRIINFEKYQHYRDRKPPWIKIYRELWRNPAFGRLPIASRYELISLTVLASQHDNSLDEDQEWLKRELAQKQPINIQILIDTGFVEYVEQVASMALADSITLASCEQNSSVEQETETEVQKYRSTETEDASASLPLPVVLALGEFGCAKMTEEEHRKLQAKLDGNLPGLIEDFDRWVHEAPEAKDKGGVKRKNRHAYESILAWYKVRDQKKGTGYGQKTKSQRIDEAARRLLPGLDSEDGGGGVGGDRGLYGSGLPRNLEKTKR